jgi:hypothetical protein
VFVGGSAAAVVACSLTSLEGFSGGGDNAAKSDATPADAGDASSSEAGAERFCARPNVGPGLVFSCDDFEGDGDPLKGFGQQVTRGTLGLGEGFSSAHALRVTQNPPLLSESCASTLLSRDLAAPTPSIPVLYGVDYELRRGGKDGKAVPQAGGDGIVMIFPHVDGSSCTFFLSIQASSSFLIALELSANGAPAGDAVPYSMTSTVPAGKWTHVTMGLGIQDGVPVAGVTYDGTTALARPIAPPKCDLGKPPKSIGLGIFCMRAEGRAGEVEIDNVVMRAVPSQ